MKKKTNQNTLYLTGLRGYSALAIFITHGGVKGLSQYWDKFVGFGKYGVISFFVLSAFTLSMSIDRKSKFHYRDYLLRRLARILPMYYICILIFWLSGGDKYYQEMFTIKTHDIKDLIYHLSFINLWNLRYQNTVIGVEWTVPIEMITYFIIPTLFFYLMRSTFIYSFLILALSVIISMHNGRFYPADFNGLSVHWAMETYLYCFIAGILGYKLYKLDKLKGFFEKINADIFVCFLLCLLVCLCIYGDYLNSNFQEYLLSISHLLSYSGGASLVEQLLTLLILILMLTLSQGHYSKIFFDNKIIVLLGKISFPFYLLHLPIIHYLEKLKLSDFQFSFVALSIAFFIAYLCHIIIERPFLK